MNYAAIIIFMLSPSLNLPPVLSENLKILFIVRSRCSLLKMKHSFINGRIIIIIIIIING